MINFKPVRRCLALPYDLTVCGFVACPDLKLIHYIPCPDLNLIHYMS
ncbi:hypothetical protein HMPREF3156_01825 [Neisseria sp. HMSC06F02]|nr:hypothetical protein HMPREF3156_01825 [Neisseria sp. HMSC06F02]